MKMMIYFYSFLFRKIKFQMIRIVNVARTSAKLTNKDLSSENN